MKLVLYSAKSCGMCAVIKRTLTNNPPNCDVIIKDCTDTNKDNFIWEAEQKGVRNLPTCILYADNAELNEVKRWIGIVKTTDINNIIIEYEHKRLV